MANELKAWRLFQIRQVGVALIFVSATSIDRITDSNIGGWCSRAQGRHTALRTRVAELGQRTHCARRPSCLNKK
jgi:hypothetical protein